MNKFQILLITTVICAALSFPAHADSRSLEGLNLRRSDRCAATINAALQQANIPWWARGQARSQAIQDIRRIRAHQLTLDQAEKDIFSFLTGKGMEEGWAYYLAEQYRIVVSQLLQRGGC